MSAHDPLNARPSLFDALPLPDARRVWERRYAEAIQWRDWQTCDLLLEEREQSEWWKGRGGDDD